MSSGFVALMYHGIGEPADPAEGARYTVTVAELDRHLSALSAPGRTVLDPRTLLDPAGRTRAEELPGAPFPAALQQRSPKGEANEGRRFFARSAVRESGPRSRRADSRTRLAGVALTFDDGEASVASVALPRLAHLGLKGALFMTTAFLGRPGWLDPDALRELRAAGWLVGAHGHTHRFLTTLDAGALADELIRCRDVLDAVLGEPPTHLAFPGGRTSPAVERACADAGFSTLWSSRPGLNHGGPGPLRRTAVRRGDPPERFDRLARGERLAHLGDIAATGLKDLARQALGDDGYHAATGRLLGALGRR